MKKTFYILLLGLLLLMICIWIGVYSAASSCNKDLSFHTHECLVELCVDKKYLLLLKMTSESYARHGERDFREHYVTLFNEIIYPYSESSPGDYYLEGFRKPTTENNVRIYTNDLCVRLFQN